MNDTASPSGRFLSDVQTLREKARQHLSDGAVTPAYGCDVNQTIDILQTVLATEIVCVLRYKRHYYAASGIHSESVKTEFLQHAAEEHFLAQSGQHGNGQ